MSRNFGVTSGATVGDNQPRRSHGGKLNAPHNLILFPSRSTFEPIEVSEPPLHKFQLFERALLFVLTAIALVSAAFILLLVET